ncbi:hypothetical protein [Candidatus Nitrosotalea okcheonensis]|uniref:hypothetical protein n=1 Tax=Candidatus Nitrosotalea okcheonensis TaxID=1903276 RepID=UPI0013000EAC|nr:hypothetical protein [Candidatus Nitrosotalea okcheonensis]
MVNHIVIPYNKSESVSHAFEYAIDLAEKYSSSIRYHNMYFNTGSNRSIFWCGRHLASKAAKRRR